MKRLYLLLTVKDSAANIPKNLEARRRLEFFANSLFMDMPPAKPVSEMIPFWYIQIFYHIYELRILVRNASYSSVFIFYLFVCFVRE